MTLREEIDLHRRWWLRDNDVPLVSTFAPAPPPRGGGGEPFDLRLTPGEIVDRKLRGIEAGAVIPSDKPPVALVNFGTPMVPVLAGCGFEYDGVNCWATPCARDAAELCVPPFDPDHPHWQRYLRLLEPLLDAWSWETFLPGCCPLLGPADILACMLGNETFALELALHPAALRTAAADAAELVAAVLAEHFRLFAEAGLSEGSIDWMRIWRDGTGSCYSEDVTALMGPTHFRDVFAEANATVLGGLEYGMLHIHSGAGACVPELLGLPGLRAMELSNDPNGPDLDGIIELARSAQAAGLSVQVSNWEHPLAEAEIERLLGALDPAGLFVSLQGESLAHAGDLYALAKRTPQVR